MAPSQVKGSKKGKPHGLSLELGQKITLKIERLAYQLGHGVGRHNGFVVFVPGAVPQDQLQVEIIELKKNYALAEIVKIEHPSLHRRNPPCPVSHECGGCQWQQVEYNEQLHQKKLMILRLFQKCGLDENLFRGLHPSPHEFRYRNRIQLHMENGHFGYFKTKSRQLVPIVDCLLAEEPLIPYLKKALKERPPDLLEKSQRVEVALTQNQEPTLFWGKRPPEASLFSQINTRQNESLVQEVLNTLEPLPISQVLDLYCGSGNFSFPIAKNWPKISVTGVELSQSAIQQALNKKQKQDVSNLSFHAVSVEAFLSNWSSDQPSLMLLDPPRPGLSDQVTKALLRAKLEYIIYVSCNLSTFERDLKKLLKESFYTLDFLMGFDMFPQTSYIETLALIRRTQ